MPAIPLAAAPVAALPAVTDPLWRQLVPAAEWSRYAARRRAGEHLAARALARVAAAAAVGWPGEPLWHDITLGKAPSGRPTLVFTGELGDWARANGVPTPGVSLSHAAGHAAALAWLPGLPPPEVGLPGMPLPEVRRC